MESFNKLKDINVSVVLCTYNGSEYLKKQLNSILSQTLSPNEIIIVDDCSRDDTVEVLKEYASNNSKIKLFFNEENLGPLLSFKKGISLSENEFIALCDQDDIWFNNKLEVQLDEITKLDDFISKPLVHFHDLILIDQNDSVINASFWSVHKIDVKKIDFEFLFLHNIITGCTCVINNQMKKELLKSDMKNIFMHDHLIALIAYGCGTALYCENPLIYYRSHSTSVTSKWKMSYIERTKIFFEMIGKKEYLMSNILQMEQFLKLYSDLLCESNRKNVERFVSLKEAWQLKRIKYSWLKKIWN